MPEPNTAVVEQPVIPPTEEQITETYIEARREGKTSDLPIPPPTIPEIVKPAVASEPAPDTPETVEIKATDTYLEERKAERARKRGGRQAKIEALTKEKHELEEKLAAVPAVEPPKVEEPAKVEEKPVAAAVEPPKPTERPKMENFTDVDEYQAAMALWAVEESAKRGIVVPKMEQAKPVEVAKPVEQPPVQVSQVKQEEFNRFLERGKLFMSSHTDFNTVLEAAHVRGLTMSESARTAITRLAAPEVVYWLAQPEHDLAARTLMQMDDLQQVVEIGRIAERLAVKPSDFVSGAPTPGIRLNGSSARQDLPLNEITDTDEYIRQRKLQRRGKR